jgi:protein disulfide-isomerase
MGAMKKWIIMTCILLAAGLQTTQGGTGWETNYDKAVEKAKADGKYLLLDFSGSDWCGWCIRLDKEVFRKKAFKSYAEGKLELVLLDFPNRKKQTKQEKERNAALAQKFGVQGFPTVLLLSPDEKLVGRTGYQRGGPKPYVEHLEEMVKAYEKKHGAPQKPEPKNEEQPTGSATKPAS